MELYYHPNLMLDTFALSPEEARHCAKVMHHQMNDIVGVIDGKGCLAKCRIVAMDKHSCHLAVVERTEQFGKRNFHLHIAIAPTKNRDRIEWFIEKAIEIGIEQISLIICEHSERPHIDLARIERIAISAMKQSQTAYLPQIEMLPFQKLIENTQDAECLKLIAWCDDSSKNEELARIPLSQHSLLLMIGPEGDFSQKEIELARDNHFIEVSLGPKRLRTETAGIYGCAVVNSGKLRVEN